MDSQHKRLLWFRNSSSSNMQRKTYAYGPIRSLLAHPSFLFKFFTQKYSVFLESGERYRKVGTANKFEESCRILTTISDLVIGGGLPLNCQMSTKVKQTKKSDSQGSGHLGQPWWNTLDCVVFFRGGQNGAFERKELKLSSPWIGA